MGGGNHFILQLKRFGVLKSLGNNHVMHCMPDNEMLGLPCLLQTFEELCQTWSFHLWVGGSLQAELLTNQMPIKHNQTSNSMVFLAVGCFVCGCGKLLKGCWRCCSDPAFPTMYKATGDRDAASQRGWSPTICVSTDVKSSCRTGDLFKQAVLSDAFLAGYHSKIRISKMTLPNSHG